MTIRWVLRWLRIAEDCRPQQYTHTPATLTSSSLLFLSGVGWSLNSFVIVSAWLFCCLVPLALTSYSVRGVGCSRPEPWTRLHCSEWHWCEPVALSAGQSGAPVSSKACAHGSWVSFSDQRLISWLTRWESGLHSGFQADPLFLLCCNALQVLCWDEDTLGAPEQFCRYFSVWRRRDNAYFDDESIAAASMSIGTTTRCWLCLIVPGTVFFLTWHGSHIHPETHKFLVAGYGWSLN